jgi:RimJ/RimL family protein N-acetyltransferase
VVGGWWLVPPGEPIVPILETDRLILREWKLDDFDDFAAMMGEPAVMEFLAGDSKPLPRWMAWRAMTDMVGHWTLRGFGMFAVVEKSTAAFVGRVGPWQPEGWPEFEIGWALRSEYWGRGYAAEAARRCVEFAFTELDRSHVVSFISFGNYRSIKVAERLGERLERGMELPHIPGKRVLQYGLHRRDWKPAP